MKTSMADEDDHDEEQDDTELDDGSRRDSDEIFKRREIDGDDENDA
jgi:hypothetical protein